MQNKPILHHLLIVLFFVIAAAIYCKPLLSGKVLFQHDMVQSSGAAQEITDYKAKTGKYTSWTNSMFGGMPSYTIKGDYPNNLTSRFSGWVSYLLPVPMSLVFFLLLGGYIMLLALGFNKWESLIGAMGIGLASYNFIIISAGHISKVYAVAYAAPLIAGIVLLYRGKFLLGSIISILFFSFELYSNHIQITYYLAIGLLVLSLYYFYESIKEKKFLNFSSSVAIVLIIALTTLASMSSRFWTMFEYAKYSTRGESELAQQKDQKAQVGLDRDYAFSWSYGIAETFTYIIPNFHGGSSEARLNEKSNIYQSLIENDISRDAAKDFVKNISGYGGQMYWGGQPSTSGPAYMGAIVCFLFVLGLFIVRNTLKWWILAVVVLFSMIACGKNIEWLNYFLFDYFPLFNKFRAVTMIHSLVSIFIVWLGIWGLKEVINPEIENSLKIKYLKSTSYIVLGTLLAFLILGTSIFDFEKIATLDEAGKAIQTPDDYFKSVLLQITQQNNSLANELYDAFKQDRISAFRTDVLRALALIALAVASIWLFILKKLEINYLYIALFLFVTIDMWSIAKRYLSDDDFQPSRKALSVFQPTSADLEILKDKDPHYRVFNASLSTFNDATTSYFHKSIGGYAGAKLKIIQEVIERHISKNNMNVLNMMNTKYFIVTPDKAQEPIAQLNPGALGNAWLINKLIFVNDANQEMDALDSIVPRTTAVLNTKYAKMINQNQFQADSNSFIKLISYSPDELTYNYQSNAQQFAVFSEIYYNSGLGWNCYLDGQLIDHYKVNYILRGALLPAGKHKIVFKFEPKSYQIGETISLIASIFIIASFFVLIYFFYKKQTKVQIA